MIMRMFGVEVPTNTDFVYKGPTGAEYLLPSEVGKHMPYDPKLLPVVPLEVHWPNTGYEDMVYIDDVSRVDDPVLVAYWDFHDYVECGCEICRFWS